MSNHRDKTILSPPIKTIIRLSTNEGNSSTTPSVTDMFMGTQTPPLAGEQATVHTNQFLGCCSATCSTPSHVTVASKGLAPTCSPLSPVDAMDTVDNTQSLGNQSQTSKSAASRSTKAKREKVPKKAKSNTKRKLKKPPPSLQPIKEYGLGNRFPSSGGTDEQVLGVIPCIDSLHEIPDLTSHDVILGADTGLLPLAGSEFLRRMVRQQQERYSRGTQADQDAMASFLCDVVTGLSPPGRFIVRNKEASEWQLLGLASTKAVIHELFNHGFCTSMGKTGSQLFSSVAALPPLQNVEAPKFHHLLQAAAIEGGANCPLTGFPARLMVKPYECSGTVDPTRDIESKTSAALNAQQTSLAPIDMHNESTNVELSSSGNAPVSSQHSQHCHQGIDIFW